MSLLDPPAIDAFARPLSAFDPRRDLPTLLLDLDADKVSGANASAVSLWRDASDNGQDVTQPTGANQPTLTTAALNGHNSVHFGTSQYLFRALFASAWRSGPFAQPITMVCVVRVASARALNAGIIIGSASGQRMQLQVSPTSDDYFLSTTGTSSHAGPGISDDAWHVVVGIFDTTGSSIYVDGDLVSAGTTQAQGSGTMQQLGIGADAAGATPINGMDLARAIVCNGRLNPVQVEKVTAYLGTRYGLTVRRNSLPSTFQDLTDSGAQAVRVWIPSGVANPAPLILWSHPYTQNQQISPGYFMYPLLHAAMQRGWMFAASNQHGDTWGNANSLTDLANLYTLVNASNPVSKVILAGGSMGGLPTALAAAAGTVANIKGAYLIDGVTSLAWAYYGHGAAYTAAIDTAFGCTRGTISSTMGSTGVTSVPTTASFPTPGTQLMLGNGTANVEIVSTTAPSTGTAVAVTATTQTHASADQVSDFPTKTAGHDPNLLSAGSFTGIPWRFYAATPGSADTNVDRTFNTDVFAATVAAAPQALVRNHYNGHLSPNGAWPADFVSFVTYCLGL